MGERKRSPHPESGQDDEGYSKATRSKIFKLAVSPRNMRNSRRPGRHLLLTPHRSRFNEETSPPLATMRRREGRRERRGGDRQQSDNGCQAIPV